MTEQQPLVSIVIPCYNHAQFVQETIQSVIDQDYENIELIIIDDGSKDNSVEVIQEMIPACEERFVRFEFRYRPNKGLCATLNEALEWCEGKYFTPHASDDVSKKYKVSTQVNVFMQQESNVVGVFCGVEAINENGMSVYSFGRDGAIGFKEVFLRSVPMPGQAVILNTSVVKELGGYNPDEKIEDLGLFLKITKAGYSLFGMKEVLLSYRKHGANTSSDADFMLNAVLTILVKYKNEKLYSQAVSRSYLIEAGTALQNSKKLAFSWLFQSIKYYPLVIKERLFIMLFLRALLPEKVLSYLRYLKACLREKNDP